MELVCKVSKTLELIRKHLTKSRCLIKSSYYDYWASLVAQMLGHLPAM